jgi:hypothetical protein
MEAGSVAMGSPGVVSGLLSSGSAVSALGAIEKGKFPVRVLLDKYPHRLMKYARYR